MITSLDKLDLNKKYTYADYLSWQFDEMVELIKGKIFKMSPAPGTQHQKVSSRLHVKIGHFLLGKPCQIFSAPFDVRIPLPAEQTEGVVLETVVQPDICVICDPSKLDDRGCLGAPDWIIEILSKSTAKKDLTDKFELYQQAGVKEYWIVHPAEGSVLPYRLDEKGQYQLPRPNPFSVGEKLAVGVFQGLEIDLAQVFEEHT